jgi:hypothetical protein
MMEFAIVCIAEYEKRQHKRTRKGKSKSKDLITQRAAYREFGEAWIKNAVSNSLLRGKKTGHAENSPVYFSRAEILALLAAERLNELGVEIK